MESRRAANPGTVLSGVGRCELALESLESFMGDVLDAVQQARTGHVDVLDHLRTRLAAAVGRLHWVLVGDDQAATVVAEPRGHVHVVRDGACCQKLLGPETHLALVGLVHQERVVVDEHCVLRSEADRDDCLNPLATAVVGDLLLVDGHLREGRNEGATAGSHVEFHSVKSHRTSVTNLTVAHK